MSEPKIKSFLRLLLLIPCLLSGILPATAVGNGNKKLVIINSYTESAAWSQEITAHIMNHISSLDTVVETDVLHLNNALVHDAEQYDQMAQGVFLRYPSENAPDYAILIGNMSFSLRDRIEKNWGRIPMILIAQNDKYGPQDFYYTYSDSIYPYTAADMHPLEPLQAKYNFTLVHIPNLYRQTIDMMLFMFPKMKKLVFMADDLYINHGLNAEIGEFMAKEHPQIEYEWLMGNRYNGWKIKDYLNNTDFNVGLLLSTWFYEQTSVYGYPTLVSGEARMISGARRPVFSLRSAYFSLDITGGYYPSPSEIFDNITDAVDRMISGQDMGKVPFYYPKESYPMINYPQLKKDGLSPKICPPGTVFINRPESFWELNCAAIIGSAIGFLALLALGIGYTVFQRKQIRLLNSQKALVSSMPIAYTEATVVYNDDGTMKNIEYNNSNEAFYKILHDNNLNSDTRRLFYEQNVASLIEHMKETHKPVRFNYYFKTTDRYYEIILSIPETHKREKMTKFHIFSVDVTDKSKVENELREFARKLDVTLNVARIIPWRWDLTSGKISCEVQRILNHGNLNGSESQPQMINIIDEVEYFSHIHPDDLEKVKEKYQQLLSGKIQYTKLEYRYLLHKRGAVRTEWIEVNASINSRDEDGRPTGILGSMLIITQRKLQEEQLISARAHAQESDRLKSAFLANMSHEIRTPLNAIVGFSNLLTKNPDHAKREKFINIIENNNQLLLQLISDVLDLSKVESNTLDFKIAPTDINELLGSIESTVQIRLQPGVALNLQLGAPEFIIDTDRKRLSQVFINLLTNACKFTSKGNITFGYELRDTEVYFFVRDTGIGVSEEDIPKLFKRFVKLDTFVQGTGLGLSISKHIIHKLGGEIGAESRGKGKGSTFWFTLPINEAEPKHEEPETLPAVVQNRRTEMKRDELSILIAEDNESNYLLFQSILENDYRLIHAWDGAEAVKLYDQFRPALILMDINMPVMDGYEATQRIRQLSPTVPIIAVTAYAYASDQDKILENGFSGYVSKPVKPEKLTHEIKSMIHNHFMLV